ncbi:MAG: preprotein translocase subunit YajC [Novosphingobium sp.]
MTMKAHLLRNFAALAACLAAGLPSLAAAQTMPYGDISGAASSSDAADEPADDGDVAAPHVAVRTKRVSVVPYIEAQQVVDAELSPGNDVLTYTALAAGVDANIAGRNSQAALALRYERRIGYGSNRVPDSDVISGVARGSLAIVPRTLTFEAGAMAARMSVENNGATVNGIESSSSSQIYSIFAGPSLQTYLGELAVEGHYRFGYNRVESPKVLAVAPGQAPLDVYDEGTVHNAELHAGFKAGTVLPIGLGVGAGWNREDVSNLDQRIEDKHARADATLPVGGNLALVGGVGYEDVKVSHRDAVIDTLTGLPMIGPDGRYVTDKSQPRQIAYQTDGLIWDAGVLWRPSKRTALEAHVGRRYGSTTYYGSFAYAPNSRMSLNVSAYDSISGFGGMLNNRLAGLPTEFEAQHNPLTGDIGTCVAATGTLTAGQGTCLTGALASVSSAVFRGRGVAATFAVTQGNLGYGIGAGYDRRKFIAAPGTVLASANGVIDENYWVAAYLNGRIDRASSFGLNAWANWYQSGDALSGDVSALGGTAAYYRSLTSHLSATAAVGIQGVNRELLEDVWSAQGTVGVRYSF